MTRQNFLHDEPWDEIHDEHEIRTRVFWRPPDAMMGASLHELLPGSPGFSLHMHYGGEEMGGFKGSSQHLVMEVVGDGRWQASAGGSRDAWSDAVAGPAVDRGA